MVAILAAAMATSSAVGPATAASLKRPAVLASSSVSVARAAVLGDANAQLRLGFMYEYGRGIPQDYLLAAYWYRRAAEQGNPRGQHLLGLMYDRGLGRTQRPRILHAHPRRRCLEDEPARDGALAAPGPRLVAAD